MEKEKWDKLNKELDDALEAGFGLDKSIFDKMASLDEHHKKTGQMTNREFFSSNAKGGFYEGMEWDGDEWVPNAESRRKTAEYEATLCQECHCKNCVCW